MSEESKKEIYRASYAPAPKIPQWFTDRLNQLGGRLLDGRPRLRIVWGMDARGWPWPDNQTPIYYSPNDPLVGWACFILEEWLPPEAFGTEDEWERERWQWQGMSHVEIMAPYPRQGAYVFRFQLATKQGDPLPLTEAVYAYIAGKVAAGRNMPRNAYTRQKLIADRLDKIRQVRAERKREVDAELEILYDRVNTAGPEQNRKSTARYSLPGFLTKASTLATKHLKERTL